MSNDDLPRWKLAILRRRLCPDPPAYKPREKLKFEPYVPIPLWMTPQHPDFAKLKRWEQAIVLRRLSESS